MPSNSTQITPFNSAIVLVDHQPGVASWTKSLPVEQMAANAANAASGASVSARQPLGS